jgi:uncharacterized protein YdhG (YjbR/CyaY superfamily)
VAQQRAAAGEAASLSAQLAEAAAEKDRTIADMERMIADRDRAMAEMQADAKRQQADAKELQEAKARLTQQLADAQNRASMQLPPVTAAGAAFSVQHSAQALLPAPDKMDVCAESKPGTTLLLSYTRMPRLSNRKRTFRNPLRLSCVFTCLD